MRTKVLVADMKSPAAKPALLCQQSAQAGYTKAYACSALVYRPRGPWCYETPVQTHSQKPVESQTVAGRGTLHAVNTNFACVDESTIKITYMRQKTKRKQLEQHRGPPETSIRGSQMH